MSDDIRIVTEDSAAMKYIESVAQESPNRHAFYKGMAFGLGQAKTFTERFDKAEAIAWIETVIFSIDEHHFKKEQT